MAQQQKSDKVRHIGTKEQFEQALKEAGDTLVVVDFFATWCGPCRMISPKLEEMAKKDFTDVIFLKVDVDENQEVSEDYGISAMPTFVLIKNRQKVEEVVGANEEKIKDEIKKHK